MQLQTFSHTAQQGWSSTPDGGLDSPQTLVLLFGGAALSQAPQALHQVLKQFPKACILGCSTAGEIFGSQVLDDSLVGAVARFDKVALRRVSAPITAAGSFATGQALAQALAGPPLRAVLVLCEGLDVNGSELVRGLNASLPQTVVVTGGLAADGDRFAHTWVLEAGQPQAGWATAVGLYGAALAVGHGSKGGWDAFGPERKITRSSANVLYELDGQPALALYKQYLGERASGLPATGLLFPLSLRDLAAPDKHLVRTILAVDEAQQSLTFAGDVPQGFYAQLMCANFDRLVAGAGAAATLASARGCGHGDSLALAISCVGRRLVLGEHCEEETEATRDALAPSTQQIGFYSYGELSPYGLGHCDLHNQTMTLTTLCEV